MINIFAINYSLKINFFIKNNIAIISILPNIIKITRNILLNPVNSEKLRLSIPNNVDVAVFESVKIDNLKEFSKLKLSRANKLDKINMANKKEINTK